MDVRQDIRLSQFIIPIALIASLLSYNGSSGEILELSNDEFHGVYDSDIVTSFNVDLGNLDSDGDGLPNTLEHEISSSYAPYLIFDEGEEGNPYDQDFFDIYYQVSPDTLNEYIYVTYVFAYDRDFGAPHAWEAWDLDHNGDTELFQLKLGYAFDCEGLLQTSINGVRIRRHGKEASYLPNDSDLEWRINRRVLTLHVSEDKHAMYISKDECQSYDAFGPDWGPGGDFEDCDEGVKGDANQITGFLNTEHNVGEVNNPILIRTHQFNNYSIWDKSWGEFCGSHYDDCNGGNFVDKFRHFRGERFGQECSYNEYDSRKEDDPVAPTADFYRVWVDHNVYQDDGKGMLIHANFSIHEAEGINCQAVAFFYYSSGGILRSNIDKYSSLNGQVTTHDNFIPRYQHAEWEDFILFIPIEALNMAPGRHELKFRIELQNIVTGELIGFSDYFNFTYTGE